MDEGIAPYITMYRWQTPLLTYLDHQPRLTIHCPKSLNVRRVVCLAAAAVVAAVESAPKFAIVVAVKKATAVL